MEYFCRGNRRKRSKSNKEVFVIDKSSSRPLNINSIETIKEQRFSTCINELDRVLGGGVVKGSLVLVGGDPGIGKSTLLIQVSSNVANSGKKYYTYQVKSLHLK